MDGDTRTVMFGLVTIIMASAAIFASFYTLH